MNDYKINYALQTITITKNFAKKANDITTEEYKILRKLKKDYPNMQVIYQTSRRRSKNSNKGLTYENMIRYIKTFNNSDEILKVFNLVRERSAPQKNSYQFVRKWFLAQFPNYQEIPPYDVANYIILKPLEDILPKIEKAS